MRAKVKTHASKNQQFSITEPIVIVACET